MELNSRAKPLQDSNSCVVVIDDDSEFRDSLGRLLRAAGFKYQLFGSVADFLAAGLPEGPTCLILDVRMPGRSGLDLQRDMLAASLRVPIIFMTAYGDIPMTVQAMKGGAVEFLTKPFRDQDLLDAVNVGLAHDQGRREHENMLGLLRERVDVLTPRERAIMFQVAKGRLNKQIAGDMGITETTVKVHRSNMMRKVNVGSLPELCRMVDLLNTVPENQNGHS